MAVRLRRVSRPRLPRSNSPLANLALALKDGVRLKELARCKRDLWYLATEKLGYTLLTAEFHRPMMDQMDRIRAARQSGRGMDELILWPRDHYKTTVRKAQMVQDLNAFYGSPAGQDPLVLMHFSGVKQARMWNELLDLEQYDIVEPFIRITEQSQAQTLQSSAQEQMMVDTQTPSGIGTNFDPEKAVAPLDQAPAGTGSEEPVY